MFGDVFKNKRVFITGHSGFKGAWLSQWLIDLGAEVGGYSLEPPSTPNLIIAADIESKMSQTWFANILDRGALSNAMQEFQPHFVFHLAAQSLVRASYSDPVSTFDTNVIGTANVLEECRKLKSLLAVVNVTSDKCYENLEWVHGYREEDRMGGKDPYSASKGCSELVFSSFYRSFYQGENSPMLVSCRAGNVIGGGDWAADRIVPDCMRAWADDGRPTIRSPFAIRPWQHVLEPLSGYLWVAAQVELGADLGGEGFNFGPSPNSNQNVETLVNALDYHWQNAGFNNLGSKEAILPEAGILKLTIEKARSVLGWVPTLRFEETVEMTSNWYRQFYSGTAPRQLLADDITHYQEIARERQIIWTN